MNNRCHKLFVTCYSFPHHLYQAHKAFNVVERFRSRLELDEQGLFVNDVSLPTVKAIIAADIGQGEDHVRSL